MKKYQLYKLRKVPQGVTALATLIIPLFKVMQCYNYLVRKKYFTKQSHLCLMMSKQLIELLLVKFELPSKMLLHHITMNSNKHYLE